MFVLWMDGGLLFIQVVEAVPRSSFLLIVSCVDKSVFGVTELGTMTLPGKQLTSVSPKVLSIVHPLLSFLVVLFLSYPIILSSYHTIILQFIQCCRALFGTAAVVQDDQFGVGNW